MLLNLVWDVITVSFPPAALRLLDELTIPLTKALLLPSLIPLKAYRQETELYSRTKSPNHVSSCAMSSGSPYFLVRGTEFAQSYNNSVPFKKEDAWRGWLTMTIQEIRQKEEIICTPRV